MASSRGKKADQTTQWSKTKWDEARQLYYNDRYGPDGKPEYYWHTTGNEARVPRGFGTQETSEEVPDEAATYSSSATSGTIYPPAGDGSYTTSSSGHSWPASNPTYNSPVYPTQTSSTGTGSGNYGGVLEAFLSPIMDLHRTHLDRSWCSTPQAMLPPTPILLRQMGKTAHRG